MNASPAPIAAVGDRYRLKENRKSLWKVEQVVERGVILVSAIYTNPHRHLCEWEHLEKSLEKIE